MVKGKCAIDDDGTTYNYYFRKTAKGEDTAGKAYTGIIIENCYYDINGVRLEAEYGVEFKTIPLTTQVYGKDKVKRDPFADVSDEMGVLVGTNGKLKSSGSYLIDGYRYYVKTASASVTEATKRTGSDYQVVYIK